MHHPTLLNLSNYYFLNSSLSIEDIVSFAVNQKHKYVVISDFESSHSWVKFYKQAKKYCLIPVFSLFIKHKLSELLLIAKNKIGYLNLLKISSKQPITKELLEGIILIHLDGEEYFLDHKERYIANNDSENGVYIRQNRFLKSEDFEFFCLLRAIDNLSTVSRELSTNNQHIEDYLYFDPNIPSDSHLIKNIYKILDSCEDYEIFDNENKLNFFENPKELLRQISNQLFKEHKFENEKKLKEYKSRLDYELEIIESKQFCEYFLIVYDAIKWAKENNICIGPGRGSVCGSLLAYILGITEIDPIKYCLYFERFLNPTRTTIPDIDIDIASNKRDLLINYLKNKYGNEYVALIATFQTFKLKNSLKEISRAYEIPSQEAEYCLKNISFNDGNASNFLNSPNQELQNFLTRFPKIKESILKIWDFPKNSSIHAAGVVISSKPLNLITGIQKNNDLQITQWEAEDLKNFGLIKFDFLSLNYLTVLNRGQEKIESKIKKKIDWTKINENDPKVFRTINEGNNVFIFQFENPKIKQLIQKFRINSILDLALISSIHRPGASDQIPVLLARRASNNSIKINEPFLKDLTDTYGLLIYQEQLMQLIVFVTGCSFGEADTFRRNILSSNLECKKIFFKNEGAKLAETELNELWFYVSKFAKYSFNKSHAIAYAIISYRLLWLKTYYPDFFYGDLLTFQNSPECLEEIQKAGFCLELPSYGISDFEIFKLEKNKFYFPINKIFGISLNFLEKYSAIKFKSTNTLDAIKEFLDASVSEEDLLILIRAGYFNKLFKEGESEYFWESNLSEICSTVIYVDKDKKPLFDLKLLPIENTEEIKEKYKNYKLNLLKIDFFKEKISNEFFKKHSNIFPILEIENHEPKTERKYIGFITFAKESKTFKDVPFLWIKFSDNFYSTPFISYFGENFESIKEAAANKYAAIVSIDKKDDYLNATKIKIFKKNN